MRPAHLFLIDPLEGLNRALDSSLRMMLELARLGHDIYACEPRQLTWRMGEKAAGTACFRLQFPGRVEEPQVGPVTRKLLSEFRAVHMRKDPPFDMDYVATTWLLDTAVAAGTRVYNAPAALRALNEKLAIFRFKEDAKPALLSADPDELLSFLEKEAQGDAVLKPLDLFGGRGVERLTLKDGSRQDEVLAQLKSATADGVRMRLIQTFDPAIFAGEVRVFTAFGEPLAWCLKRPAPGNFLANTRAGAKLELYQPRAHEVERVTRIAKQLMHDGVVFVGFDLIGGYVSEINLTSPRLLTAPDDHENHYVRLAALVAQDLGV